MTIACLVSCLSAGLPFPKGDSAEVSAYCYSSHLVQAAWVTPSASVM